MPKTIRPVVDEKTKKLNKIYAVVGNVTKVIKKVYAVVGGITKLVWSDIKGLLKKSEKTASNLNEGRYNLAAITLGNYALFGGGIQYASGYKIYSIVDVYNTSLTRQASLLSLSHGAEYLAATSTNNYALFSGEGFETSYYNTIDAFDKFLVKSTPSVLSSARYHVCASSFKDYALFASGYNGTYSNLIDIYDDLLTHIEINYLSEARAKCSSTSNDNYVLFAGAYKSDGYSSMYKKVDVLDSSFTLSVAENLSTESHCVYATATINDYMIFGGGRDSGSNSKVDAYDNNLVKYILEDLSTAYNPTATTLGNYVLFGFGKIVESYDDSLTKTDIFDLSVTRNNLSATTLGNYALFVGGYYIDSNLKRKYNLTIDVYELY